MPISIDGDNIIIDGVIKDIEDISDFNFNTKLQARQGDGVIIDNLGIISFTGVSDGSIPIATNTILGGVMSGGINVSINETGIISSIDTIYTDEMVASKVGDMIYGNNLLETDGVIHVKNMDTNGLFDYTKNITPPSGTTDGIKSSYITDYVERMYPPIRDFTSNSRTITGQAYGNGIYNVTSSSSDSSQYAVWKLFTPEETIGSTAWASQQNGSYNSSGVYTLTNSTRTFDNVYYGEWVKIEFPFSIIATKMGIERYGGYGSSAPKSFKIYGSNDNNTWTNIYTQTNATYNQNISNSVIEFNILGSLSFKYFVIIINIVAGNNGFVSFNEWFIYGKKTISLTDNSYFLNYSNSGGWAINNLSENTLIQSLVSRIEALEG
jgi:hypothetical protein